MREDIVKICSEIGKILDKDKRIVIFSHVNPDGDAVGSAQGLYHYLKSTIPQVTVVLPNNFPAFLNWIPENEKILQFDSQTIEATEVIQKADILFYCDFNDPNRIEKISEIVKTTNSIKIMIDHHPEPVDFADFMISDTSVSSTSELIYEFISLLETVKPKGKAIADCLMAGIITDTGLFNHNSENRRTFEIVADLLDMGADKKFIIQKIYNEYPYDRMRLLGNSLHNRLKFYPEFATAFIYLPKEDLIDFNHQMGDTEGFVNIPLSIGGVKFSALFIEKEDQIKISFRSNGNFDVNQFARKYYHGGGHKNASGGKSYESLNNTIDQFVQQLEQYKKEITSSI
jgi:bifunctional oligoribonuclease and PAP phosphatase NrnA